MNERMNERIEEFAERVAYYGQWEGDGIYTGQLDLVVFAELIVRECIKQARKDENGLAYEAVGRIAEHFGIK